jgi:hypothetical protein
MATCKFAIESVVLLREINNGFEAQNNWVLRASGRLQYPNPKRNGLLL